MDVFVSSIRSKHNKARLWVLRANFSYARDATHPFQTQIHYGQVRQVLSIQGDRVFPAPGFRYNYHVRLSIDNGADADPYNWMVVDDKHLNLRGGFDSHY
jgi:hypothetical protein